jgi:hypothetical protein
MSDDYNHMENIKTFVKAIINEDDSTAVDCLQKLRINRPEIYEMMARELMAKN